MLTLVKKKIEDLKMVPVIVGFLVIGTLVIIPFRVISYGYLPPDDALRHSAKAMSGKAWSEILVLRDDVTMDSHPGWHAVLGFVHKITKCNIDFLAVFSVIFLFILFCLIPAVMLTRSEAWITTLLFLVVAGPGFVVGRLFLGRPYIFTMAVVLVICFLWTRLKGQKMPYGLMLILALSIAFSTWIHGGWYFFALPVFSCFLARERQAGFRLLICVVAGFLIGAAFTGQPYVFLQQTFLHAVRAFSSHQLQRMLVSEFQPFSGAYHMVLAVMGMLAWRHIRKTWDPKRINNPVFILGVTGWVLGFISVRFWYDWGMPAVCVWLAQEFNEAIEQKISLLSLKRVVLSLAIACTLYIAVTKDSGGRWTNVLTKKYLSMNDPEHKDWLPEPGGIFYNTEMTTFYDTFYKNPNAPWRYVLGFEPAIMTPDNLAIFRSMQWKFKGTESLVPWASKMNRKDRLVIQRSSASGQPGVAGLEWRNVVRGIWIGRLPRNAE